VARGFRRGQQPPPGSPNAWSALTEPCRPLRPRPHRRRPRASRGVCRRPAAEGGLLAHKVGTRYVQSRTAAGGWSQQRFARRRDNQADELVGRCRPRRAHPDRPGITAETGEIPIGGVPIGPGLIVGGDKATVAPRSWRTARLVHADATLPRRTATTWPTPTGPCWRRRSSAARQCGAQPNSRTLATPTPRPRYATAQRRPCRQVRRLGRTSRRLVDRRREGVALVDGRRPSCPGGTSAGGPRPSRGSSSPG
jgi:hypothetical protein